MLLHFQKHAKYQQNNMLFSFIQKQVYTSVLIKPGRRCAISIITFYVNPDMFVWSYEKVNGECKPLQ